MGINIGFLVVTGGELSLGVLYNVWGLKEQIRLHTFFPCQNRNI